MRGGLLLIAALAAMKLSGCAAPSGYMGISFAAGAAPPELQRQAERAISGDKAAQLALGIAWEEGAGAPVDIKRAKTLYRLAAAATGGTIYIYQLPVRAGGRGGVIPVNLGPIVPGLPEAKARLVALKGKGQ